MKEQIDKLHSLRNALIKNDLTEKNINITYTISKASDIDDLKEILTSILSISATDNKQIKLAISNITDAMIELQISMYEESIKKSLSNNSKFSFTSHFKNNFFKYIFGIPLAIFILVGGLMVLRDIDAKNFDKTTDAVHKIVKDAK